MPLTHVEFLNRYPLFNDPAYGSETDYNNALMVAELDLSLLEKTGLNWHTWRNQALEYRTACVLQETLEAKIVSSAQSNTYSGLTADLPQLEKRITVEGEYTLEYITPSDAAKNSNKTTGTNYYCKLFENIKEVLTDLNIGDGILYSGEF